MSDPVSQKISDRIRKLLSLAQSTNENEAQAALAMAQKLMQEHKLTEADVAEVAEDDIVEESLGSDGFAANWKFLLATAVARGFFCEAVGAKFKGARARTVRFFGKPDDVATAKTAFAWILEKVLAFAEAELNCETARMVIDSGRVTRHMYRTEFLNGAAMGVGLRLKKETDKFVASSSTALTIVKDTKEKIREHVKSHFHEPPATKSFDMAQGALAELIRDRGAAAGFQAAAPFEGKQEKPTEPAQVGGTSAQSTG